MANTNREANSYEWDCVCGRHNTDTQQVDVVCAGCQRKFDSIRQALALLVQSKDTIKAYEEHVRREIKRANPKAERP
jgi:hypothetical protein